MIGIFFAAHKEKETLYLAEYDRERRATGKIIQEKAWLKQKYMQAMAERLGVKPDTLRKKQKKIQALLTEILCQRRNAI